MSLSNNYPTIRPSLLLDFANVTQLDPRITFTRATTATYYDGKTVAKAEENLLLYSQEFDNSYWVKLNCAVTGSQTAPNGSATAALITALAGTFAAQIGKAGDSTAANLPIGSVVTSSVFAKAGTNNFLQIVLNGQGANSFANFDLSAGTVGTVGSGVTAAISAIGGGWYRCAMTFTLIAANNHPYHNLIQSSSATRNQSYTWAGTETVFLWGAQLEQRSAVTAYTPTTTQPITNYIPQLLTAAANVARFEHNPTTGESLGLEIEEQRTNLLTYSEQFDNAAWTKTRASITANTIVAPDGTLTGDKLVEDATASNTHQINRAHSVTSGTAYTLTIYAKAAERSVLTISFATQFPANSFANFNLSTGTVTAGGGLTASSATLVGNGWYRCSITSTASSTASATLVFYLNNGSTISYTGDGYSGLYIWGAQLEAGAFPTSYIPTVAAQVTRSADAASMTGTNFSSWYNAAEGTLYAEYQRYAASIPANSLYAFGISDNSFTNIIALRNSFGGTSDQFGVVAGNVAQAAISVGTASTNVVKKAGAYRVNSFQLAKDGTLGTEDTSGVIPVVDRTGIGCYISGGIASEFLNGTIKKIAYYPLRVTNAQLQALTS